MSYVVNSLTLLVSKSKIYVQSLRTFTKHGQGYWRNKQITLLILTRTISFTRNVMASSNILFNGQVDRFKGITVHSDLEPCGDIQEFSEKLEGSLKSWAENGHRGIWFRVHLNQSDWVPLLVKKGFKFHHARDEHVMMVLWLPETETSNIPHYAHTMVGVGAVVINDDNQVLVVREKHYPVNLPHYKLPGGYVEPRENLVDAAIREVNEETNIRTEFVSLLTLRHGHRGMFHCSDIYVVIHLKALSHEIEKCDREILESKWMDVSEFLNHPHIHELNKFFVRKYLEYEKRGIKINCFHGFHEIVKKPYTVYSVTNRDLEFSTKEINISDQ